MQVNGLNYHVETTGTGPVLVLLHGFTGSSRTWDAHIPVLSKGFRTVTIDLPGHGQTNSPTTIDRYIMQSVANDVVEIIGQVANKSINLLGYSMGGRLALYMAIHYPNLIDKLILESASPGLRSAAEREQRRNTDEQLAMFIETEGISKFVDYWQNLPLFASHRNLSASDRAFQRQERLKNTPLGLANSLRGMGTGIQPSLWEHLESLHMPVLLLTGVLDSKFVFIAQQMHQLLPLSRLTISDYAGHTVHLEDPSLFESSVYEFIAG